MDPVARLRKLRPQFPPTSWQREDFWRRAREGKQRWENAEACFGINYPMFGDALAVIDPGFELSEEELTVAKSVQIPRLRNVDERIAVWFLKWSRHSEVSVHPNPYEPWIEIWENGGSFSVEHGQFVDIYAPGMTLGAIIVRRA